MANKRRRGRSRKSGPRHANGHLKAPPQDSPRLIAAGMPHRRGLGEQALAQGAASELGRMVLRGELEPELALAGEYYASTWRGYVATLNAPRWPWRGEGRDAACQGCPSPDERKFCLCDLRKRVYLEAFNVLLAAGHGVQVVTCWVAIEDRECPEASFPLLRAGLAALGARFGLTRRAKPLDRNAASPRSPAVAS